MNENINNESQHVDAETPANQSDSIETNREESKLINELIDQVNSALIGQKTVVKQVVLALLSNGHVLLEGVPGLGKTLLVRALSKTFEGEFKRIQFTPDLMPSDITGHVVYDMATKTFQMNKGPIFTNILLADEINRAPAKSQSALLEVMQEKQVTTEGQSRKVCLLYTSPSPRDATLSRMPSSA